MAGLKKNYGAIFILALIIMLSGCSTLTIGTNSDRISSDVSENSDNSDNSENQSSSEVDSSVNYSEISYGETFPQIERIVTAYKQNDNALLDDKDLYILNKADDIIKNTITDNLTEIEKAEAIHDYMLIHSQYDTDHLSEFIEHNPDSATPYGLLKNGKAICMGYTQTFQLFMEMLDINSIIVHATANGGDEHAWNMIEIDNKWRHVDVTWDDPIPDMGNNTISTYFFVTSSKMERTGHEWDKTLYPDAQ